MCCPAKLAPALSSSTRGRPHRQRRRQRPHGVDAARPCAATSPDAIESTSGPGRATPGGTGSPARSASPRPTAFAPYRLLGVRLDQRHDAAHPRTVTVPVVTVDPHPGAVGDPRGGVAGADDAGDAVLPRDDRRVRQRAAAVGDDRAEQRQQDVERLGGRLGEQHVALLDAVEVRRTGDAPRRSLPRTPELAPRPRITVSSCASSETAEHLAHRGAHRGHQPGHRRRELRRVGHRRRGVAQVHRGVLRGVGLVVGVPRGQLVGRRRRRPLEQRAHLVDVGEDDVLGIVQPTTRREPTAGGQRGPAHQPGRPDVAVDTALVAHAVADAGLRQQRVVLLAVLLRHVAADLGDLLRRRPTPRRSRRSPCGWSAAARRASRARSGSRCRTRRAAGSRRSRGSRSAPGRSRWVLAAGARAGLRGPRPSRGPARAAGSARYAATSAACCGEPPPEIWDAPRISPSSFTVGRPVHCLAWTRKSLGGMTAVPVKAMCCLIIEAWWSRQRRR